MTSTDYTTDPAEVAGEQAEFEAERPAEVAALENGGGIGAPLLIAAVGGMGLLLAVLAPVSGVKLAGMLIVAAAVMVAFRLLRRGGGAR